MKANIGEGPNVNVALTQDNELILPSFAVRLLQLAVPKLVEQRRPLESVKQLILLLRRLKGQLK